MSQESWGPKWTATVGAQVRMLRKPAGFGSVQELADRCVELGFPIPRSTIANMENGQRPNVTVQEVTVLAAALGVPPVRLLYPLRDGDSAVDVLPGVNRVPIVGFEWFSGRETLGGDVLMANNGTDKAGVSLARMEHDAQRLAAWNLERIPEARQKLVDAEAGIIPGDGGGSDPEFAAFYVDSCRDALKRYERGLELALGNLRQARGGLVNAGMAPPPLRESIKGAWEARERAGGTDA